MWTSAAMVEAFDAQASVVAGLASEAQKVEWWNQGQARFLQPKTFDLTWAAAARTVALPSDFISIDKLIMGDGVTPQPWRPFGEQLVLDVSTGATDAGSARLHYWAEFAALQAAVWVPHVDQIAMYPLDESSGSFENLITGPGLDDLVFQGANAVGAAQVLYRDQLDRLGAAKAMKLDNPANVYPAEQLDNTRFGHLQAASTTENDFRFLNRLPFTVAIWIDPTGIPSNLGNDTAWGICGVNSNITPPGRGWHIVLRHTGQIDFRRIGAGGAGESLLSAAALGAGYQHVCCTYDGTTMKVYLNGAFSSQLASSTVLEYAQALRLGMVEWPVAVSGQYAYFDGIMDDLSFFDAALSPADVLALFEDDTDPRIGTSNTSELTTTQDHAALYFALSRFYRRLSSNRAYYKRYATLVGQNAVSPGALKKQAKAHFQDFLDAKEDAHLHLTAPAFYYESE